jgi:hypothetical protein
MLRHMYQTCDVSELHKWRLRFATLPHQQLSCFLYFSLTSILWNTKHNVLRYTTRMYFLIVPSSLNSKAHLARSSWWERTWWSKSSGICGTESLGGWFRTLRRIVVPRGRFTMKLTKLKLQGPSIARASSRALGGTLNKLFTFEPSCVFVILYFFREESPKNCISFRPHKTRLCPWWCLPASRVKKSEVNPSWAAGSLMIKAPQSFGTLGTTYQTTQCHIPECLHLQRTPL